MSIDRQVLIIPRQDPLNDLIIIGVPQLDLEPLGPSLEPTIATLHVTVAIGQIQFPSLGLDMTRLGSVATGFPDTADLQQLSLEARD